MLVSLVDKKSQNTILNGACYSLKESNIIFDIGRSFYKNEDFYLQIKNNEKLFEPHYNHFSKIINLFISHIHEDHYAGIFNIPSDILINLYIGEVSFDILQYKALEIGKPLPSFNEVNFFKNKNFVNIEHWNIIPVSIPHNIVDTWGFVVKRSGNENKFIYSPDISECFWNYFNVLENDTVLIDILPMLPDFMYNNDLDAISKSKQREMGLILFVDYGWDFDRINYFMNNYFFEKRVFFSKEMFNNSKIVNFQNKRNFDLLDFFNAQVLSDGIYICSISELYDVILKYPKLELNVISNVFELSINNRDILSLTSYKFYNFFKSGHLPANKIEEYKRTHQGVDIITHN
ncbi:MAG: hypothetical protein ACOX3T_04690 [Bdellovibrionota bacterium]